MLWAPSPFGDEIDCKSGTFAILFGFWELFSRSMPTAATFNLISSAILAFWSLSLSASLNFDTAVDMAVLVFSFLLSETAVAFEMRFFWLGFALAAFYPISGVCPSCPKSGVRSSSIYADGLLLWPTAIEELLLFLLTLLLRFEMFRPLDPVC